MFGIAYEKNQLSGFQGIKFPWKPTLSGSVEYHGPPRSCCFCVLVIVNTAAMNTGVYASLNYSFQFSSVAQSCPAFCDSMNCIIVLNLSF